MNFKKLIAAAAICLAVVSCNKNEEVEPVCLDGNYAGKMELNVAGSPVEPVMMELNIKGHLDNKLTLVAPTFNVNAMGMTIAMPEMTITDINVTETEGLFNLKAAPFSLKVEMMGSPMVFESKKGLTGTVQDGKLKIAFDITPGSMPMAIDCTFEGSLK